jgi:hypothetical protein
VSLFKRWKSYSTFLQTEFSTPPPSLFWRVRGLLRSHPSQSLVMLDPHSLRRHDYFAFTLERRRKDTYNGPIALALFNKIDQKLWLDKVMPSVAPPLTHYFAGTQTVDVKDGKCHPFDSVFPMLEEQGELFLKPSGEGQGRGAFRLALNGGVFSVNGKASDSSVWLGAFRDASPSGYTISRVVSQGGWSEMFFPPTLNTLRVLTGTHRSDHRPILLAATMKMGRPSTFPTDNWKVGRGGVAARVMIDSGQLASGLHYDSVAGRRELIERHPETGAQIKGVLVPNWSSVRATMLELAALLPFPGLVGWDVALTKSGIVIVEANTGPGLDIHQCHGSLTATAEQIAFWKEMRML